MTNIIVAFSKRENAVNIRNILTRSGATVSAVCLTGSKVLQHTEMWNQGIVICGARLQDMPYTELKELLPDGFEILLIAPSDRWIDSLPEGIVGLPSPLKAYDLLNTVEMMSQAQESRRRRRRDNVRKRSSGERQVIERAKALLMERNGMSEEEAHRYLQKTSMEGGRNMTETAQMVLSVMDH
ncbi:ANTAR domain-containing response regulator [[Ruminococcus] torques]|uniref:ANTAR domain-containing response regulator n=1 Tax=[Ruminococcus] torques TaxID=33039 RepID=UPI0025A49ED8|nr:ANTAR domain-containing protein [[Ruminococcus] torques]MDM8236244.1 ANTAR domain-containing protein [[Ruminococcus] torques]